MSSSVGVNKPEGWHLELQHAISGGEHVLKLTGEVDLESAPELEAAIVKICATGPRAITLDLSGLSFIDSTGLHVIASASQRCKELGSEFRLLPGPPGVQRVFELTGLIDTLQFAPREAS
jgi:anti-sigma B factor antagonist